MMGSSFPLHFSIAFNFQHALSHCFASFGKLWSCALPSVLGGEGALRSIIKSILTSLLFRFILTDFLFPTERIVRYITFVCVRVKNGSSVILFLCNWNIKTFLYEMQPDTLTCLGKYIIG